MQAFFDNVLLYWGGGGGHNMSILEAKVKQLEA